MSNWVVGGRNLNVGCEPLPWRWLRFHPVLFRSSPEFRKCCSRGIGGYCHEEKDGSDRSKKIVRLMRWKTRRSQFTDDRIVHSLGMEEAWSNKKK